MTEPAQDNMLMIEAPERIFEAPRTLLAEMFADWLIASGQIEGLPAGELVVSITDEQYLGPMFVQGGEAVGCFVVARGPSRATRWEIAVAYGGAYQDEADVEAWLTTIPHELLHMVEFYERHGGRLPSAVAVQELLAAGQNERDEEREDVIENRARRITNRFVLEHPEACRDPALLRGCSRRRGRSR